MTEINNIGTLYRRTVSWSMVMVSCVFLPTGFVQKPWNFQTFSSYFIFSERIRSSVTAEGNEIWRRNVRRLRLCIYYYRSVKLEFCMGYIIILLAFVCWIMIFPRQKGKELYLNCTIYYEDEEIERTHTD